MAGSVRDDARVHRKAGRREDILQAVAEQCLVGRVDCLERQAWISSHLRTQKPAKSCLRFGLRPARLTPLEFTLT